ncbi:adenosine deaminase family protein [Herbiconiux moechotypicola]|uniref:adenosine deaminase family protein n=1 Tax=Herbiconiux moechotypicola TaxID=637393 RepID=UPI00217D9F21|nr:adenosine deaminase family protein [Herbiconiux moechotypicola]MCS5731433.1 adenosine deaminase family protein [Herbiconiux moechotypicola]
MSGRELRALPKVHAHVHLDGSYPLAAVQALAARQGADFEVPDSFPDVWDFFEAYGTVPELVRSLDDLAGLCRALVHAEAALGVLYLEPAIEPQLYARRLGGIDTVARTMVDALAQGAEEAGIEVGANLTVNTDQDEPIALELARTAAALAGPGVSGGTGTGFWRGVTALGTAGFVEPAGLARFVPVARIAQDAGLQIVSHAGQTGGPDSILEALDVLGATRLSHGVRAVESDELVARLAEQHIVCDICPVSNVRLGVSESLAAHPGPLLIAAGVPVTLNADDPLWFGHSVLDQWRIAREVWGLDDRRLAGVSSGGMLLPGMSPRTRSVYRDSLAAWFTAAPG